MIPISSPMLAEEEKKAVLEVMDSGMLVQGPRIKTFEEKFANYVGTKHAIATSSGTTALHISLLASGLKKGDEVITTPFSFIASANSILFCGARPVFVDIHSNFNIDPDLIQEKITEKTKAILPVHLYGQPCNMYKILKIANDNNLIVIEDACQAHGAEYDNKKVGSFATGCFSFYPTKNMIAGEGGIITTNNDKINEKARMIRNHGQEWIGQYKHRILGYNFRMTDLEAAIAIEQLKKLDEMNQKRIENARYMTEGLSGVNNIITPSVGEKAKHVFNQYTLRVLHGRDELKQKLEKMGIQARIYYPLPIYKQPLYEELGYTETFPETEKAVKEVLSIPVHPGLLKKDLDYIIDTIKEAMK